MTPIPSACSARSSAGRSRPTIVLRDDQVTAFRDINPQMPTHVLIVPNQHIANTEALEPEHDALVGEVVRTAREVARRRA